MLLWPLPAHTSAEIEGRFPQPTPAKGTLKITEKRLVATANFHPDQRQTPYEFGSGAENGHPLEVRPARIQPGFAH